MAVPVFPGILAERPSLAAVTFNPQLSLPMEPQTHFGKIGLTLGLVSGALSMLAIGMVQVWRRPELAGWSVLLLLVAAACYLGALILSIIGLRRDDSRTYAKAGLVLIVALAFPLVPVWLVLINALVTGAAGR